MSTWGTCKSCYHLRFCYRAKPEGSCDEFRPRKLKNWEKKKTKKKEIKK